MPSHTTDKPRQSSLALIPAKQIETHLCQWCGNLLEFGLADAYRLLNPPAEPTQLSSDDSCQLARPLNLCTAQLNCQNLTVERWRSAT